MATEVDDLEQIRARLAMLSDPVALLEGLFAHAPVGFQIYRADGHCLLVNPAFRRLFGSEPPPHYNVLEDDLARAAGVIDLIHRAFKGETITLPPTWYDPRQLKQVEVSEGRRVAVEATFFPLRTAGEVSHVAIVYKDLTAEVTAKEQVERRQHEAERQRNLSDAIIAHSGDGIIVCSEDGVIRVFNPEAERQHGVTHHEVASPEWTATFGLFQMDGAPLPLEKTPLYRALHGERVENAHWRVRRPDGVWRVLTGTASPIRKPDGSPGGAMVVSRDETERLKLEEQLRGREGQYRFLAESMPQIVWTALPNGQLDYVNDVLARYLGSTIEVALGTGWHDIVHPQDLELSLSRWTESLTSGAPYEVEHRIRRRDGVYRWFLVRGIPMRGDDGRILKWFGTSTDIHDLKESEGRARSLFDSQLLGIGFWSLTGEITDANGRLLAMLGFSREEIAAGALRWKDLSPPEYASADAKANRDLLETGAMTPHEKEFLRKDGTRIPVVSGGALLPGTKDRGVFFALDVTEQAAARREIERLVGELNEAVKARDDFLSIAGHELRTPLTALQLQVQTLQSIGATEQVSQARLLERLGKMDRQVTRLETLISELLSVSRITAGQLELRLEPFDLVGLTTDVAERFAPQVAAAKCELLIDAPDEVLGEWDRSRLDQVISNVIGNAIKYGAGQPIGVKVRARGAQAELVVQDRGIGIPPEAQQRIFERFERAVSQRHYGGLGLGLWIARQTLALHGGTIRCKSASGEGTAFIIELPRSRPP